MFLERLHLLNFKNYADYEAVLSERINCFAGPNGVGKTNLLDAIHYLSFCKSYFNPIDSQNIRHDEGFFMIQGIFKNNGETSEIYCGIKRNQKKVFKKNKTEYERLSEHIGQYPLVMISPSDSDLVNGSSEGRRKFLDGIISQYDRSYLDKLIAYNNALRQRNVLLRQFADTRVFDAESLDIWDSMLALHGDGIHQIRVHFLKEFIPLFNAYYQFVSNSRENASLTYECSYEGTSLHTALMTSLSRDRALGYTTMGPHRDDLDFKLDGFPLKKYGSQGQQKSFLIALKLAQYEFIRDRKNTLPLLLLDDVYDKLDADRFGKLLEKVSGEGFGQVFITDTHADRIREALEKTGVAFKLFEVV